MGKEKIIAEIVHHLEKLPKEDLAVLATKIAELAGLNLEKAKKLSDKVKPKYVYAFKIENPTLYECRTKPYIALLGHQDGELTRNFLKCKTDSYKWGKDMEGEVALRAGDVIEIRLCIADTSAKWYNERFYLCCCQDGKLLEIQRNEVIKTILQPPAEGDKTNFAWEESSREGTVSAEVKYIAKVTPQQ